jgi:2-polyprenyl-6-methoxyphenol hydroxylase-like FAD-dependent oxidoreductase
MLNGTAVRNALIIGGGLAGLSAALSLARHRVRVHVIDHASAWPATGAGLTLGAATLRALQQLGVLEQVMQRGHTHEGIQVCDVVGRPLRFIASPPLKDAQVPGAGGILRSVLHDILIEQARTQGIGLQLGLSVNNLAMKNDAVQVHLSNGEVQHWDLVIAADGLSSQHRTKYFPEAQPARFTGQGCWRVVLPRPAELTNRHFFLGGRCKLGLTPVSQDQMYLFLLEHVPTNPWRNPHTQHLVLRDLLADYGGLLVSIRDNLGPESGIVYRPLESHFLGQVWHRDRLILIGDAAHATTPQLAAGAGMGIEDGLVLGQELGRSQTLEQALQAFMQRRHDRCHMVVNNSLRIGELEVEGASPEAQTDLVNTSLRLLAEPI